MRRNNYEYVLYLYQHNFYKFSLIFMQNHVLNLIWDECWRVIAQLTARFQSKKGKEVLSILYFATLYVCTDWYFRYCSASFNVLIIILNVFWCAFEINLGYCCLDRAIRLAQNYRNEKWLKICVKNESLSTPNFLWRHLYKTFENFRIN